jgi:hypothetical protein
MKYNKLKNIITLLTLSMFLLAPITILAEMPPPPPNDNNIDNGETDDIYTKYNNSDFNFSINYPEQWNTHEENCETNNCTLKTYRKLPYLGAITFFQGDLSENFTSVAIIILERKQGFKIKDNGIIVPGEIFSDLSIEGLTEVLPLSVIQGTKWKGIERGFAGTVIRPIFNTIAILENNLSSKYIYEIQYVFYRDDKDLDIENEKTIYRNIVDSLVVTPEGVSPLIDTDLIRASRGYKVYEIKNGKRHWIPTAEVFNAHNFNWNEIQIVSEDQLNSYPRAKLLRATDDKKVYYLTESGMVRHIPSPEVFNSYGNNWEDIFEVSPEELRIYEPNSLIRAEGDYRVYLLENGKKRWIQTAEEFNVRGYNWNKIAPVNQTEIDFYQTGDSIG